MHPPTHPEEPVTHPHVLWCRAAAWSLNSAMGALWAAAEEEAKAIAAELAEGASDGLRSTVYGARGGSGGHGDPAATAALHGVTPYPRPNRFAQLHASITDTLGWLANTLTAPERPEPLGRLMALLPHLQPGTAATVTRWLEENDRRARDTTGLRPHLWALPGAPECPRCGQRALYVQTAAPSPDWTVICRTGCVCTGQGCPCRMPVRVEGVAHIWDRSAPLVAAAFDLARPVVAPYQPTTATPDGIKNIPLPGLEPAR